MHPIRAKNKLPQSISIKQFCTTRKVPIHAFWTNNQRANKPRRRLKFQQPNNQRKQIPVQVAQTLLPTWSKFYNLQCRQSDYTKKKTKFGGLLSLSPIRYPPTMVIIDLLVPGHMAKHCKKPTNNDSR